MLWYVCIAVLALKDLGYVSDIAEIILSFYYKEYLGQLLIVNFANFFEEVVKRTFLGDCLWQVGKLSVL